MELVGSFAFTISDINLNFEEIEKNIGIIPTTTINKGQVIVATEKAPFDIWSYEIEFSNGNDTINKLCCLLNKLMPYSNYINEMSRCYRQVVINCFLRSDMGQIGLEISSEVVSKLNNLGIGINFHILSYGYVE
ncbi:MAG: DUF4279 domain-containing protein [Desulfitobacteriaceae bacterium]|nr:DUF4279 domain-containing protein [Desulfitobacteriaceae bacterium]